MSKTTILTFSAEYDNYAGLSTINGVLQNTPTYNEDRKTYLATMKCDEFTFQYIDAGTGEEVTCFIPAGNYTVGAKGPDGNGKMGQFRADLHKEGAEVSFNINFKDDQAGPLLTLAPFVGVSGTMPKIANTTRVPVDSVQV